MAKGYQSIDKGTASGQQPTQTTGTPFAPRRPWRQLADRSAFAKPESFADARYRLRRNLRYFRVNYAMVLLVVLGFSMLWHPIALLVLAVLVAAWIFLYFKRSEPLTVFGRSIGPNVTLGLLGIVTIVALFFANGGIALLCGLVVGVIILVVHGSLRGTEDLFTDEEGNAGP